MPDDKKETNPSDTDITVIAPEIESEESNIEATVVAPEINTKEVTDYISAGLTDCIQTITNAETLFPCNTKDKEQITATKDSLQSLINTL